MRISKFCSIVLLGAAAAIAFPGYAQQAAEPTASDNAEAAAAAIAQANAAAAASAKAAQVAPATPAPIEPSPAARKKAQNFGFHAEIYDGKTMFCRDDATLGTRLVSKKCMGADQFEDYAVQLQIARDLMKQKATCQGGGLCGGIQ